jgi:hypothetical protein
MELVKMGVDNLEKLTMALCGTGVALDKILDDMKITPKDIFHAPALLSSLKDFAGVSYGLLLPEVSDMDDVERERVANLFRTKFNIKSDAIEVAIEEGLALVLSGLQAVLALKNIGAKVNAAALAA